jgi:tetratricopeptide (TPR) repeat protein
MEAANRHAQAASRSAEPASGDAESKPVKIHLEFTLPGEMRGELRAWRRSLTRIFANVMEHWLESALRNPGVFGSMPGLTAAPQGPAQQAAALPPPAAAAAVQTPPTPQPAPNPPEEMPLLLVDDGRPVPASKSAPDVPAESVGSNSISEARSPVLATETTSTAATLRAAAQEEGLQLQKDTLHRFAEDKEKALACCQQAHQYRLAGEKEKALACYEQALALDPHVSQAYLGRASVYVQQRRFHEALIDCNLALRQEPKRTGLYVLRGLVYARMDNAKRALEEAEAALRCDPRSASAYMLRGTVRFKKGMFDEALLDVKQAIRLRPNDVKFRAELGRLLVESGKHEQAARIFAKVLELAPDFHEARLLRGTALRLAGEVEKAEAEITDYLQRCPRTAAAYYQRGLCRLTQRNYAQAAVDFDKAINLNPKDEAVHQAKQQALEQWEKPAREARALNGSAATVATAATATDAPSANTAASSPLRTPSARPKPPPFQPRTRSARLEWSSGEPMAWLRPLKWACALVLIGLVGFGGFRALAHFMHDPNAEDIPSASVKLNAEKLVERFKTGSVEANKELIGQIIEVTGVVVSNLDDKTPPVVVLSGGGANLTLRCTLKANLSYRQQMQLARIVEQSKVTLVGKCAGPQDSAIAMNECHMVNVVQKNANQTRPSPRNSGRGPPGSIPSSRRVR